MLTLPHADAWAKPQEHLCSSDAAAVTAAIRGGAGTGAVRGHNVARDPALAAAIQQFVQIMHNVMAGC